MSTLKGWMRKQKQFAHPANIYEKKTISNPGTHISETKTISKPGNTFMEPAIVC
jgi:hypothetical protein